jgi:hypothetical protein
MKYEIGAHSDDGQTRHVALIDHEGKRDELFDVALYDPEVTEDDGRTAHAASLAALETLVERANAALGNGCTCDDEGACGFCFAEAREHIGSRVRDTMNGNDFVVTDVSEKDDWPTLQGEHYWGRVEDIEVVESGHYCQNCEWRGPAAELKDIKDYDQRVAEGEPVPSGECPECGALCQPSFPDVAA